MRGILSDTSPHVLMLINGIPRTSVYLGNPDEQMVELPVGQHRPYRDHSRARLRRLWCRCLCRHHQHRHQNRRRHRWYPGRYPYRLFQQQRLLGAARKTLRPAGSGWLSAGRHDRRFKRRIESDVIGRSGSVNLQHEAIDGQIDLAYDKIPLACRLHPP